MSYLFQMNLYTYFFLFFIISCSAQKEDYKSELMKMDSTNQTQLDTGISMMDTERTYFLKLHNFMNTVYDDLIQNRKANSKILAREQSEWLASFELISKKIWEPINNPASDTVRVGNDDRMFAYGDQANLVHQRIVELMGMF